MKSLFLLFVFITSAALAQNVQLYDYDVPVSSARTVRLNGSWNWSQTNTDSTSTVKSNNASGNLYFRAFYSSLPFAWFINLDASGGKNFDEYNHDVSFRPTMRKYLWDDRDLFGFISLDARHRDDFKQVRSDLTVGYGYGRYINATALAKAVRIEEHFIDEGIIDGHLPKETMLFIAKIIDREDEFRNIYGEAYEQNWLMAIEEEIVNSGQVNSESIGAVGILRIRQVLFNINERVNERYYGWDISLGIKYNLTTAYKEPTSVPALTLEGRYSFALNWRNQVNMTANINTRLDSTFLNDVNGSLSIDYIYELSNKINFVMSYLLDLNMPVENDIYFDHTLNGSFLFYLENNIYLGINGNFQRNGLSGNTDLSSSVVLQYNLF